MLSASVVEPLTSANRKLQSISAPPWWLARKSKQEVQNFGVCSDCRLPMTRISGAPIPPNGAAQMRHRRDAGIRLKIRLARLSLVWPRVRNSRQNCSVSCPGGAFGLMTHSPRQGYPGSAISPPPASTGADLPVGIFARDLPVTEGPEVAAPDLEMVAIGRSPGQGPFRGASVTHHEMIIVAVMEDRQTRETCRQTFAEPRLS